MPDPAEEGDLTASWSPGERATAVRGFERLADRAEAALQAAEDDNLPEALANWRAVVGADSGDENRRI